MISIDAEEDQMDENKPARDAFNAIHDEALKLLSNEGLSDEMGTRPKFDSGALPYQFDVKNAEERDRKTRSDSKDWVDPNFPSDFEEKH